MHLTTFSDFVVTTWYLLSQAYIAAASLCIQSFLEELSEVKCGLSHNQAYLL